MHYYIVKYNTSVEDYVESKEKLEIGSTLVYEDNYIYVVVQEIDEKTYSELINPEAE